MGVMVPLFEGLLDAMLVLLCFLATNPLLIPGVVGGGVGWGGGRQSEYSRRTTVEDK
jgi:hypothetical protein